MSAMYASVGFLLECYCLYSDFIEINRQHTALRTDFLCYLCVLGTEVLMYAHGMLFSQCEVKLESWVVYIVPVLSSDFNFWHVVKLSELQCKHLDMFLIKHMIAKECFHLLQRFFTPLICGEGQNCIYISCTKVLHMSRQSLIIEICFSIKNSENVCLFERGCPILKQ